MTKNLVFISALLAGCALPAQQTSNYGLCTRAHFWSGQAAYDAQQELQRRGYVCPDGATMRAQQTYEIETATRLLTTPSGPTVAPPPPPVRCTTRTIYGVAQTVCQ